MTTAPDGATSPVAATWRRVFYPLADAALFIVIWQTTMSLTRVRFPFGIMQSFSPADYDAYVRVMSWMTIALFLLSLVMHRLFAGSIGKLVFGMKTVQRDGSVMTGHQVLMRSAAMFLLGLLILAPGPLIAFIFGKGSEPGSLVALSMGFLLLWLATFAFRKDASLLERALGLKTVRR
jgi:uncharacterized RDD family membrane protein YckC